MYFYSVLKQTNKKERKKKVVLTTDFIEGFRSRVREDAAERACARGQAGVTPSRKAALLLRAGVRRGLRGEAQTIRPFPLWE